jgi:two-component sensor histidine kinase
MIRTLGSRLFRQIASLCLIAMLPIVAALAYQAYDRRAHAIQRGGDAVFHATEALIADVRAILHSAEETLTFVVNSPAVQRRDWAACQELVTQVHRASERMAFVGVVDAAGTLVCPSIPSPEGATVADRLFFQSVRTTMAFSVGEYAIGRSSGRPSLHLSYPVIRDGEFAGAANMALDIEWLAERLAQNKAPASPAVVYILDQDKRIVAKSHDAGPQLGARIDMLPSSQDISDVQGAVFESNSLDGVARLVRMEQLIDAPGGKLWSVIGVDKSALTAPAMRSLIWALAFVGFAVGLAVLFLWISLARLVVLPIRALDGASESLKKGEVPNAVEADRHMNEVGELAETFNEMAIEVAGREKDRQELARKDALLREVSHRVKNHLASIASMMRLESRNVSPENGQAWLAMHHRILAVAELYDLLAQRPSSVDVRLSEYIKSVCAQLATVIGGNDIELHTRFEGDLDIEPERAMAIGFLVNEILTNSVKHAFPSGKGRIDVDLDASRPDVELRISDNGVGLPKKAMSGGIGASIINSMVRQVDGELAVEIQDGTSYRLSFPAKRSTVSAAFQSPQGRGSPGAW